jgi:hypothetical protein
MGSILRSRSFGVACSLAVAAAVAIAAPPASDPGHASPVAVCTAAKKAQVTRALKAFTRTMAAKRKTYFRAHKTSRARATFVRKQTATLKRLRAAARCVVRQRSPSPPSLPTPAPSPTPPSAPPPPQPPPAPPPLTGPGLSATYLFGAEVSPQHRELLQSALDVGARYIRTALGRELPPTTVYAHTDLEAMIVTSANTRPRSLADSRALWGSGTQFGEVDYRVMWIGPPWFSSPEPNRSKIAIHEAVHVLQAELAGRGALGGRDDEVPPAGPKWLFEGHAEWTAYQAVDRIGLLGIDRARAQWIATTKAIASTPLSALEVRAARPDGAYDIYALAVDFLLRGRDPASLSAYLEAIGRGTQWRDSFAATFGVTIESFYADFAAYRQTL